MATVPTKIWKRIANPSILTKVETQVLGNPPAAALEDFVLPFGTRDIGKLIEIRENFLYDYGNLEPGTSSTATVGGHYFRICLIYRSFLVDAVC